MPMTLDEIVEEVRHWPAAQLTELVDRLTATLPVTDPAVEDAWRQEVRRRVEEIESGPIQGIPGEAVSAQIRRLVGR